MGKEFFCFAFVLRFRRRFLQKILELGLLKAFNKQSWKINDEKGFSTSFFSGNFEKEEQMEWPACLDEYEKLVYRMNTPRFVFTSSSFSAFTFSLEFIFLIYLLSLGVSIWFSLVHGFTSKKKNSKFSYSIFLFWFFLIFSFFWVACLFFYFFFWRILFDIWNVVSFTFLSRESFFPETFGVSL